ncbi:MAG: stage III sporulation protein AE, partial [Oscillibacter sp.]|nr:stage III sporulation protein AE [Oscillibacter sp.]
MLEEVGEWNADGVRDGLRAIVSYLQGAFRTLLRRQARGAAGILFTAVLCAAAGGVSAEGDAASRLITMAGGLTITYLSVGSLDTLMGVGLRAMEELKTFSHALLPTLAAAAAAAGGITGASFRQVTTVFFSSVLLELIRGVLSPLVWLHVGALAGGTCLADTRLLAAARALKTVCTKLLTSSLLVFTVY